MRNRITQELAEMNCDLYCDKNKAVSHLLKARDVRVGRRENMQLLITVLLVVAMSQATYGWSTQTTALRRVNQRLDLSMRWGLKGAGQANKPMGQTEEDVALRDTVPFELRGFSLPTVVFSVGVLLTTSSFAGYFFNQDGGSEGGLSSLGFVYGIPVFLIGLSLFYAEIKPVIVMADDNAEALYERKKTDTMDKIRKDVTRHRYGDDAHLDSTLEALGLKLPQKKFPKMQTIELSETPEGELVYTMTFQSAETPFKVWNDAERVQRYNKFFGPGIDATVQKIDADKRIVALTLTTTTGAAEAEAPAAIQSTSAEE